MKPGDIFYSVMQKDNNPFEKPRITKFIVEKIYDNCTHPIFATKTDKWGRHYCFKESQIYLTYEEAIPEKQKIQEKIKQWEKDVQERNKKIFEEQEIREKQRQIEHDKQVRKEVCEEIYRVLTNEDVWRGLKKWWLNNGECKELRQILDQIQGELSDRKKEEHSL